MGSRPPQMSQMAPDPSAYPIARMQKKRVKPVVDLAHHLLCHLPGLFEQRNGQRLVGIHDELDGGGVGGEARSELRFLAPAVNVVAYHVENLSGGRQVGQHDAMDVPRVDELGGS